MKDYLIRKFICVCQGDIDVVSNKQYIKICQKMCRILSAISSEFGIHFMVTLKVTGILHDLRTLEKAPYDQ